MSVAIEMGCLRGLIGSDVRHEGLPCRVIEVLEDGPALVLQDLSHSSLQADRFGDPRRRVPDTYVVPVLDTDSGGMHPAYLALELPGPGCH